MGHILDVSWFLPINGECEAEPDWPEPVCLTSPHPPSGAPPPPRPAPALRLWKLMSAATTISRWSSVRHCSLHPPPTHLLQLQRFKKGSILMYPSDIFESKCFWSDSIFTWIWICLHISCLIYLHAECGCHHPASVEPRVLRSQVLSSGRSFGRELLLTRSIYKSND